MGLNVVLLGDHSLEGLGHLLGLELAAQLHRGVTLLSLVTAAAHPLELPVGELPLAHHVVAGAAGRVPVYLVDHVAHSPARHLSRYCVDIV